MLHSQPPQPRPGCEAHLLAHIWGKGKVGGAGPGDRREMGVAGGGTHLRQQSAPFAQAGNGFNRR